MMHQAPVIAIMPVIVTIAVVLFAIYVVTKLSNRTLAIILGGGFFLLFLSWFAARVYIQHKIASSRVTAVAVEARSPSSKTIAEQWDKLTRARIQLDNVATDEKATAPVEEEEAIEAAGQNSPEIDEPAEPPRPAWVDWPPKRVGNVYRQVIVSDRYSTVDECFLDLEDRFQGVVQVRMQSLFAGLPGSPFAIPRPTKMGIGLDYIMSEICREEYTETVSSSVGDMKRVHVLMEFDSAIDNHLRAAWQRYERLDRLSSVGGIAGVVLAGLATVFGLLKFDTWTRGYYTKRLLIGVPSAIIVLVLLLVMIGG